MEHTGYLDFEEWYFLNESEINIELAESGVDREMCFDSEKEFSERYDKYLEEHYIEYNLHN